VVRFDNLVAIFTAENSSSRVCTRHVNTRYHFISEHIEDGFIKIMFVKSCDNNANLRTKNMNKDTYNVVSKDTFVSHLQHLEEVFTRLASAGLKINA
jgi:hypothetical protein